MRCQAWRGLSWVSGRGLGGLAAFPDVAQRLAVVMVISEEIFMAHGFELVVLERRHCPGTANRCDIVASQRAFSREQQRWYGLFPRRRLAQGVPFNPLSDDPSNSLADFDTAGPEQGANAAGD